MAPKPAAERCPEGLDSDHVHVWDHAIKTLKALELWSWELSPLLREYVRALQRADWAHRNDEPTEWDRHAKRAAALADQLALTPRGRKAVGVGDKDDEPEAADPFAALDQGDELAKRRTARGA